MFFAANKKVKSFWKRFNCDHTRMIKFYPSYVTWKNSANGRNEVHATVVVEGCLNCGKMRVKDFAE